MRPLSTIVSFGLLWASLAVPTSAQRPVLLRQQNDIIVGIGQIQTFQEVVVNNAGDWIAQAGTDASTGAGIILRNGVVTLREGTLLSDPPNAEVGSVNFINLNNRGNLGWAFGLTGEVDTFANSGLFFNGSMAVQESQVSTAPELSEGTIWRTFRGLRLNDTNQILTVADVDDPAINGIENVLLRLDFDVDGNLISERVLALEGDTLPGSGTRRLQSLSNQLENLGFNNRGDVMFIADMSGSGGDVFLYLNETLLAREDGDAPFPGATYRRLDRAVLDLNNHGDYVFLAELDDGPDSAVVRNGEIYRATDDSLEAFNNRRVQSFGSGKLMLTDTDRLLHFVDVTGNVDNDTGLILEDRLLVRENVSLYEGGAIGDISGTPDAYWISANGRWLIFRAEAAGVGQAVFLMDLGEASEFSGCAENAGSLTLTEGFPLVGEDLSFAMDEGQGIGVTPFLLASTERIGDTCGSQVPYGEWLIDLALLQALEVGIPWGESPVPFDVQVPQDLALIDREFYLQGLFVDLGDLTPAPRFRLTNAMRIVVGAP